MSRYDKKQSRGRRDGAESVPLPQLKADPQSATEESALESLIGNAALADAKTNEPLTTQNDLLQSSYGNAAVANALVQRKPEGEEVPGLTPAAGEQQQSTEAQPATPATTTSAAALIVEDSAETLEPGQMRKSDFLSQLRASVSSTAAEALADTQWSEAGCPYIDQWFAYYNAQDSQHVEQAIRRYAREAAGATAASSYIPIVTGRVRRSVTTWATTGEVTGLPEGGPGLPGGGVMGAVAGVASGIASGIASAASGVVAGVGSALSAAGSILFKEREGGAKEANDPQAIQAQLGAGQSLDGSVKSRMESAYGESFSGVQVHTDASAAQVSSNLNARALTVGNQIAFGAGEYQPGTLVGDALIAHELAHVVQQGSAPAAAGPLQKGGTEYTSLEEDADKSAVGAVMSSWIGKKGLANIPKTVMPRLRSGLRLQGCKSSEKKEDKKVEGPPAHLSLAEKAESLGDEAVTMESYRHFQDKTRDWFFSENSTLDGRASKPPQFTTWQDWDNMHWQSRTVVSDLAGVDAGRLARNAGNLQKLRDAYNTWPNNKLAVFQSGEAATNTCNVFLGDALSLDGKNQVKGGKYYSAAQVYGGAGQFKIIDPSLLSRGDIVAWGGHVEIVTSVDTANDSFCSRGGYREPMGKEKCGGPERKISHGSIHFLRIK